MIRGLKVIKRGNDCVTLHFAFTSAVAKQYPAPYTHLEGHSNL